MRSVFIPLHATALLITVGVLSTGCANITQFQTAETLAPGGLRVGGGPSVSAIVVDRAEDDLPPDPTIEPAAMLNGFFGYGLAEGVEVQAGLWFPLGVMGGLKLQVVGVNDPLSPTREPGFDLSLGVNVSLQVVASNRDLCFIYCADWEDPPDSLDVHLPVYLGYRVDDELALYLTPRYSLKRYFRTEEGFGHQGSITLGGEIRAVLDIYVEVTVSYDFTQGFPNATLAVGFAPQF